MPPAPQASLPSIPHTIVTRQNTRLGSSRFQLGSSRSNCYHCQSCQQASPAKELRACASFPGGEREGEREEQTEMLSFIAMQDLRGKKYKRLHFFWSTSWTLLASGALYLCGFLKTPTASNYHKNWWEVLKLHVERVIWKCENGGSDAFGQGQQC